MTEQPLQIVVLGLSITSSWGNGHATTYRSLLRGLAQLGHELLFLERDQPWYARQRDLPAPGYARVALYRDTAELQRKFSPAIRHADVVIVGSYVPDGIAIGRWVTRCARGLTAFYDIDTPITLASLESGELTYLSTDLLPRYQLYLSFSGGPMLDELQLRYGAPRALPLYCSVDTELYRPAPQAARWDLAYLGTYSPDRQPGLEHLLLSVARKLDRQRFAVVGAQYPEDVSWPLNVTYAEHLPPRDHRAFYTSQRFTLNLTRRCMRELGYSPSVRLFEAAACGTPIISDGWPGLSSVFEPGSEILVAEDSDDCVRYLTEVSDAERACLAERARARVLREHSGICRARQLVGYLRDAAATRPHYGPALQP